MKKIAIVAVAYNRVNSLKRLLDSLEKARYTEGNPTLIISIDKSNTTDVEDFADSYIWPHGELIVDKHEVNLGLRPHMLSLGKWFETFDALVILEDDIVVSECFYNYVIQCVDKYSESPEIAGVSLYGYEVNYQTYAPFQPIKDQHDAYFMNCAMSWGQVWLKESWNKFYAWYKQHEEFVPANHLPEKICGWSKSSWLKYHTRYCIEENLYFVYPYISLSTNYGDTGVHNKMGTLTTFQTGLQYGVKVDYILPDFSTSMVKYDGFFENKILYAKLGVLESECCLDIHGTKRNRLKKRYWLTTQIADYKVVKSFALRFRPIEVNVINNIEGNDIFLYDTTCCLKNRNKKVNTSILYLHHISDVVNFIRRYGVRHLMTDLWGRFISILKRFI